MNPGRFFTPNMGMMGINNYAPFMASSQIIPKKMGLFGKIGSGIKSVNWGGLLSGANKTLNVVNQTIPLVKQAKPMFSNMRSMVRLAKAFGSETTSRRDNSQISQRYNYNSQINQNGDNIKRVSMDNNYRILDNSDSPQFFV